MKRLVIAVDCDDVLVPSTEYIINTYNRLYGTDVQLEESHSSHSGAWGVDKDEAMRRIHNIQLSKEYGAVAPFTEAVLSCRRLAKNHELHLVSARAEKLLPVTNTMLDQYLPGVFNRIEHLGVDGNKGDICRLIGADVLIDDNQKHLVAARNRAVNCLIWFGSYPWQSKHTAVDNDRITHCLDWVSVEKEIKSFAER